MIPILKINDIHPVSSIAAGAANGTIQRVHVPWPEDTLGIYGSRTFDGSPVTPDATDRAMDRYVLEHLAVPAGCVVTSIIAGRAYRASRRDTLHPCIVVTLMSEHLAQQLVCCQEHECRPRGLRQRLVWVSGQRAS